MAACLHRLFEAQTPIGRRRRRSIKQAKQLCQQRPGRVHAQQQRQRHGRTRCSRSRRRRYRGVKWPSRQGRYIICVRPCWRRHARQALKQRRAVSLSSPRRRRALEAARRRTGGQTLHVRLQAWRTACPGGTRGQTCAIFTVPGPVVRRGSRRVMLSQQLSGLGAMVAPARAPTTSSDSPPLPSHHAHHSLPSCLHAQAPDSNASRYVAAPPRFALAPLAAGSASRHKPSCALSAQAWEQRSLRPRQPYFNHHLFPSSANTLLPAPAP
jgi:hypothetical protein